MSLFLKLGKVLLCFFTVKVSRPQSVWLFAMFPQKRFSAKTFDWTRQFVHQKLWAQSKIRKLHFLGQPYWPATLFLRPKHPIVQQLISMSCLSFIIILCNKLRNRYINHFVPCQFIFQHHNSRCWFIRKIKPLLQTYILVHKWHSVFLRW